MTENNHNISLKNNIVEKQKKSDDLELDFFEEMNTSDDFDDSSLENLELASTDDSFFDDLEKLNISDNFNDEINIEDFKVSTEVDDLDLSSEDSITISPENEQNIIRDSHLEKTLLKAIPYKSDEDFLRDLTSYSNYTNNLSKNDYAFYINKAIELKYLKSLEFLLSLNNDLSNDELYILKAFLENEYISEDEKILSFKLFKSLLSKFNRKSLYEADLGEIISGLIFKKQKWPIQIFNEYLKFEKIKNPVNIIEKIINHYDINDLNSEHHSSISYLLSLFIKKIDINSLNDNDFYRLIRTSIIAYLHHETTLIISLKVKHKDRYESQLKTKIFDILIPLISDKAFVNHLYKFISFESFEKNICLSSNNKEHNIIYYLLINDELNVIIELLKKEILSIERFVDLCSKEDKYSITPYCIMSQLNESINRTLLLYILKHYSNDHQKHETYRSINLTTNEKADLIKDNSELFNKVKINDKNDSKYEVYNSNTIEQIKYKALSLEDDKKNSIEQIISKISPESGYKYIVNNDKIKLNIETLRNKFPNFNTFIDFIESNIYLNELSYGHFNLPPSLLVGSAGIGKTFFMNKLSEMIGIESRMINMESVSAGFVLVGNTPQWHGAKSGLIFDHSIESKNANHIFLLDEIDKINFDNNRSSIDSVLLPLLEGHTSKNFIDEYVGVPIDISKAIWIATANEKSSISKPLLSRFNVFDIPEPNFAERKILTNEIYITILNNYNISEKFSSSIDNDVLDYICEQPASSRDLRKDLTRGISNAVKRGDNKLNKNDVLFVEGQSKKFGFM